ncbi:hypothetical protein [Ammoniphilus sp. CFH 90114]|uniref:hypothetical protein n=1 Tax=Ammoniphilus sp. CFH 90114 TaxID=2493665 RepID=UPI00100EBFEF|nr:hypothetical protein [Ammoniphilus sp. CFH 90114]RXT04777.1 hypothetical protein EIZ39_18795 [Ammoniphilus sp. CFH 90114]
MNKRKGLIITFLVLWTLTGCSIFQASPEEIEQYKSEFIALVDEAAIEAENGQKVLEEVRNKVDKEGLKKTKAQNTILNGVSISKAIKEDVIKAQIPEEMEPVREKLLASLNKRIEAYDQLFKYYDFLDEKHRVSGDALLEESFELFSEVLQDIQQFKQ